MTNEVFLDTGYMSGETDEHHERAVKLVEPLYASNIFRRSSSFNR